MLHHKYYQGGRKDRRGNEPVGSCAMCDARSNGPRALEGKYRGKKEGSKQDLVAHTKFTVTDEW